MKLAALFVAVVSALIPASAPAAADGQGLRANVLTLPDLPKGFKTYASFRRAAKDAASETGGASLADYGAWGFTGGWEVIFVPSRTQIHVGSAVVPGPQAVWASADVYRDVRGAQHSFAATSARCNPPPPALRPKRLQIGDTALLCKMHAAFGGNPPPGVIPVKYAVIWRRGKLIGAVRILALKGGLAPGKLVELTVTLAEKQDKRMT
jgi:hypothetical protein